MGSDKIFMFDNPAAGESAGIMSMIPALLQNKGILPQPGESPRVPSGRKNFIRFLKNIIPVAFLKMMS